jgi:hypothetical protein
MSDEPEPQEPQEPQEEHRSLERCLDPEIIAGIAIGVGTALSGPLHALTDHYLEGHSDASPPPEIELPPGISRDDG